LAEPASAVFFRPDHPVDPRFGGDWWRLTFEARWDQPLGEGSAIAGIEDHPVVHIAYEDALAYAAWAGKALPTETEWEYAARGGLEAAAYAWGEDLAPVRRDAGQLLARRLSRREPADRRLRAQFARSGVRRQWPRPVRHDRQCLGMDHHRRGAMVTPQTKTCCTTHATALDRPRRAR
jgi:sulfatase modifying factor 1